MRPRPPRGWYGDGGDRLVFALRPTAGPPPGPRAPGAGRAPPPRRGSRAVWRVAVSRVAAVAQYQRARFPRPRVYGRTPGRELRLITCGGPFDPGPASYLDNAVVFARLTAVGTT